MRGVELFITVPDALIFLASLGFYMATRFGVVYKEPNGIHDVDSVSRDLGDSSSLAPPRVNTYLLLPTIFLISMCFPSILSSIYFIAFLSALVLRICKFGTWRSNALYTTSNSILTHRLFPVLFPYTCLYIIVTYLYQIKRIQELFDDHEMFLR